MNNFVHYWEHISSGHRVLILMAGLIGFWIIEGYYPLINFRFHRWRHAGVNLVFLACTLVLNLIFGFTTAKISIWVQDHHFGLLYLIAMPIWLNCLLAIFLLDLFGQYLPHILMHKVKWMWKFHLIHHSDTTVDVTTGTRHHPGEWLFRETFTVLGVVLLGIPVAWYLLYRSVSGLFTHFNHANVRVPEKLDWVIRLVFVSPNLHKSHHHYKRPQTDTNFSNIFSIWDRLFGTFHYEDPKNLKYGLDVLEGTDDQALGYQFRLPFDKTVPTDY